MHRLSITDPNKAVLTLKRAMMSSPDSRHMHRAHGVLLVARGISCYKIARWFDEDPRTVERWVHHFELSGLEGLRDSPGSGRRSRFAVRKEALSRDVKNAPRQFGYDRDIWNGRLLADHLRERYGIVLSVRQCQRILKGAKR